MPDENKEVAETQEPAVEPSPAESLVADYDFPDLKGDAEKAKALADGAEPAKVRDDKGRFLPRKVETVAAPPPPAPKHTHSKLLVRQAAELGLSDDEVADTPTEELRDYIREQQYQRLAQRQTTQGAPPEQPQVTEPIDLGLGELANDLDPRVIGLLTKLASEVQSLKQYASSKTQEENTNRVERAFSKHSEFLGSGTYDELERDGAEMARRNAVAALVRGWEKQPGSLETKIDKAVSLLRGGAPPKTAAKPAAPAAKPSNGNRLAGFTPEEWNAGTVAKPTSREGAAEEKGVKLAKKTFLKQMAELNSRNEEDEIDF